MQQGQISITFMSGPRDGDTLAFDVNFETLEPPLLLTVGRREDMDICLHYDSEASRLHVHIGYDGDEFWIEDLDSSNGTFLEGNEKVEPNIHQKIQPDMLFRVGRTWLRIDPLPSDITAPAEPIIIDDEVTAEQNLDDLTPPPDID